MYKWSVAVEATACIEYSSDDGRHFHCLGEPSLGLEHDDHALDECTGTLDQFVASTAKRFADRLRAVLVSNGVEFPGKPIKTICFLGWSKSGKDFAAKLFSQITGWPYAGSSSWMALPHVAKAMGMCEQEAWEARHHPEGRLQWKQICEAMRVQDPSTLLKSCLARSPIVTGLRNRTEIKAGREQGLVDLFVWIKREGVPQDPTCDMSEEDCDLVLDNPLRLMDVVTEIMAAAEGGHEAHLRLLAASGAIAFKEVLIQLCQDYKIPVRK